MHLTNDKRERGSVAVSLGDRSGRLTSKKKKSITFGVDDTTMEELEKFIKDAVEKASK